MSASAPGQPFRLRRLGAALGAEIIGLDLTRPLDAATVAALRAAWLRHQLLLFRGQRLSLDEQLRFSEYFGQVDDYPLVHFRHPDNAKIMRLSSETPKVGKSSTKGAGSRWHSDLSFTTRPSTGSLLHAQVVPEVGGDTLFANQYLAYDTLSPAMRVLLEPLHAVHELFSGFTDISHRDPVKMAEMRAANPRVAQPMVRRHEETGRPALYVGPSLTTEIEGMTREESAGILQFLFRHATRHELIYRHQWQPADMLMWDNRCLLHIVSHDYQPEDLRVMHRTTLTGTPSGRVVEDTTRGPTLAALAQANS